MTIGSSRRDKYDLLTAVHGAAHLPRHRRCMNRWQSTLAPPSGPGGGGVPGGVDEAVVPYNVGAALQDGREGGVAGDEAGGLEVR